ncbi:MAG: thioredoxin domain-containing protein [Candidatus Spechtbacterales bacterium]
MLIEFYGTECGHCTTMAPLVQRLQQEEGVQIEQREVWHNEENATAQKQYDVGLCGGVPFFYNTETKQHICGEASYEELKTWALGTQEG